MNDLDPSGDSALSETRQLIHEIKNHLYVVNIGLEILQGARTDSEEFSRIMRSIRQDGLEPLKASLAVLFDLASQQHAHAGTDS